MAPTPLYGIPNYEFVRPPPPTPPDSLESVEDDNSDESITEMAFWYMVILSTMLLTWMVLFCCIKMITLRQKTRNQSARRLYGGSRTNRQSSITAEPTIYVSPANLPPPPKYEAMMAPPSYEEVVGIHYPSPNYQNITRATHIQPITQPITAALAGTNVIENRSQTVANGSQTVVTSSQTVVTNSQDVSPPTVITVTSDDRRTSVVVTASS